MKPKLPGHFMRKQYLALAVFGALILIFQLLFYYKTDHSPPPQEVQIQNEQFSAVSPVLAEFNPNDLDAGQWQKLGFSEKQAATILKYKDLVGGQFISKEQLKKCFVISAEKFQELRDFILLPETGEVKNNYKFPTKTFEKKALSIPGKFNPDNYSTADWQKLGFSENQANAILNYKNYLGGSFVSKEKFKDCFIISSENYQKLAPFLLLPEKTPETFRNYSSAKVADKPKIQLKPFDPNSLDNAGWQALGFSEKQAQVIVNYRDRNLKGSFKTAEDIEKCFVISTEKFAELKPYIRINPENIKNIATIYKTDNYNVSETSKTDFSKIDLNQISLNQLREFGFNEKSAAGFIAFRKSLGGFVNKNQVFETYGIDREIAEKLVSTSPLNPSNVQKYTLLDAPESWLKTHPYFKYSADKIVFYRITNPDERKIWKFIKTKPEYEAKMRMYLK